MLMLLIGGLGLSATGLYLAARRIGTDVAGLFRSPLKARHRAAAPPAGSP